MGANTDAPLRNVRGYIDGCFDMMHSGHFNAIRQAKQICDTLVVGIHSDEVITESKALPVFRQKERYALLEHLKWIDEILPDVPYSPEMATLERARADFCIHGDDMPVNAQGECAYDGMKNAGKLKIIRRTEGVSTTDMIGRLLTLAQENSHDPVVRSVRENSVKEKSSMEFVDIIRDQASCAEKKDGAEFVVDEIVSKYCINAADASRLRDALPWPAEDCSPSRRASGYRSSAPVQMLASTRRVLDFASGNRKMQEDDKVVYVSGSFDLFHVGHADFLKSAKALGSFLLVGIYDDSTVKEARGPHHPLMNIMERVLNVLSCKWVDEVIIGAPREPTQDLVRTWSIKVIGKGTGLTRYEPSVHQPLPPQLEPLFVPIESKWPDLCGETIIQRILDSRSEYVKRNQTRAKREDEYYNSKKV